MSLTTIGQRCMSEPEPELGLGTVISIDRYQIGVNFPAAGEQRIYAADSPVLQRVQFRDGETIANQEGEAITIESIEEENGLLVYIGSGKRLPENTISDITSFSSPHDRLMKGQVDDNETFNLRHSSLKFQTEYRQSNLRGFMGGRVELIPHQFYILNEVAARQNPRVLLADEVGLGKTIEACLILQRLLAVGKASRVIILVPETLIHQWFVELLRRFNLWFSIFDEERCFESERSNPDGNPFLDEQLILCSVNFLANSEKRYEQAIAAEWDMVIVDEAHHLDWTPEEASPEYEVVEKLALQSPGLLLLTATPTQLGLEGHFARLRLLDPDRYDDYDRFLEEADRYGEVAQVANKIIENQTLTTEDNKTLKNIFNKDLDRLETLLGNLNAEKLGAREQLINTLLDEHGTGRVIFRNTRENMTGFPKRRLCPVPLGDESSTPIQRVKKELQADASNDESGIRYSFKEDERLEWLVEFLNKNKPEKVLLICKSQRKALALEAALQETNIKVGLFHEGLTLIQRDRNAAWFGEADGAQLLVCSEIGSEGRNFQFAHHLVLFDLPLNPGLLEQRIGRLDRIGQTDTIQIHAPYIKGSCQEFILQWYHQGIDAIESPLHGGNEYQSEFGERLLNLALAYSSSSKQVGQPELDAFIEETRIFKVQLTEKLKQGRDRLLELNSFDKTIAENIVERVAAQDTDTSARSYLKGLMDHFGVRVVDHEEGDVFLDPSRAYVEAFPSIPHEGMLATFDRSRAITREDLRFISEDHPLFRDAMDLLINSPKGSTAFAWLESDDHNILVEAIFVLETIAQSKWHVEQFLAPTPIRIVVDIRGSDLSEELSEEQFEEELNDADIHRFLEQPVFNYDLLKNMIEGAKDLAEEQSTSLIEDAKSDAEKTLGSVVQRLVDLRRINDHIRIDEIESAQEQFTHTADAIINARLRLDSIRLILEGPESI